jgi:hypothetical protein
MSKHVKCHGDETRFEIVADFIYNRFGNSIKYIADVAGGQGLLSRILNKKYNYESEVIDPRGYTLKGVPNRKSEYTSDMAGFYDLIVGLHPDEATRPVVESVFERPILVVPCCNFWDRTQKLGAKELVGSICDYLDENKIVYERVELNIKKPKNIALITGGK